MLAPGPSLFLTYKLLAKYELINRLALFAAKKDLANMIASFAYTMLGFLAAVITILFVFTNTENYAAYKRNGYLRIFFYGYFITIASLLATALLSLYGFSQVQNVFAFQLLLMFFANSLIQVFIITFIICNIARNSFGE